MKSLAGTLFKGVTAGAALVLLVVGMVLYFSVRGYVLNQMDRSLLELAGIMVLSVEEKPYGLEIDLEEMRLEGEHEGEDEVEHQGDPPAYLQVGSPDGKVFYSSHALGEMPLGNHPDSGPDPEFSWERLPDGTRLRSVRFVFIPAVDDEEGSSFPPETEDLVVVADNAPGDPVVLRLFRDSSEMGRFVHTILLMLLLSGTGSLIILAVIIWVVIRKAAQPVHDLAERIEGIGEGDLPVRIPEGAVLRELVPVASGFNQLLEKIEDTFARERSFTSNAAHELRTPLAGLKTGIEVALTRNRTLEEYREALEQNLFIVNQMDNLVKGLLAMIRVESGQEAVEKEAIPLEESVDSVLEGFKNEIKEKGLELNVRCSEGQTLTGDRLLFSQVLYELIKNAVYYVNRYGSIRIEAEPSGNDIRLTIGNSGSLVDVGDAGKVFDRFWRGEGKGKDAATERFGLGLPLVKRILGTMGGRIELRTEKGGDFTVTVIMPLLP